MNLLTVRVTSFRLEVHGTNMESTPKENLEQLWSSQGANQNVQRLPRRTQHETLSRPRGQPTNEHAALTSVASTFCILSQSRTRPVICKERRLCTRSKLLIPVRYQAYCTIQQFGGSTFLANLSQELVSTTTCNRPSHTNTPPRVEEGF